MQNFNYHTHTYRCGHADLIEDEEYVKEYIKMGFKKVAFTDHCPEKNEIDKRTHMRMKYSQKVEYLNNIRILKEKYAEQIEIQTGYEVEYLPGEEENLLELKNETDKLILGQHFIYGDNKQLLIHKESYFEEKDLIRYGEYVKKAIELGIPDIIAHPDIYLCNATKFGETDRKVAEIICKTAETHNIPLEINLAQIFNKTYYEDKKLNNDSFEKQKEKLKNLVYPRKEFWKIATNYNIKVLYGIDVHHKGQISLCNELVNLANWVIGQETIDKLNFIE